MITGLPPYKTPLEQGLRCVCGRYLVVFVGGSMFDGPAFEAARDRASNMNAEFIDAREIPFMNCDCGQVLDFTTEASTVSH